MRSLIAAIVALVVSTTSPGLAAALSDGPARALPTERVFPSVFESSPWGAGGGPIRPAETLRLEGTRLDLPTILVTDSRGAAAAARSGSRMTGRKAAFSIASSALLPGLGELMLYFDSRDTWTLARVGAFFALEGYFWYGYRDNRTTGKDFKRQYEEYADAHWDLDRFLLQHPCCDSYGGCDDWRFYNENCQGAFNYFLFTPKEADREEYYENVGKYNAFAYGWDDWVFGGDIWTPHRRYYWSLRGESDKHLLRADQFIMALILNRVVSMVDTGWLAYRMSKGSNPEEGWSLRFKTYDEAPCLIISRGF